MFQELIDNESRRAEQAALAREKAFADRQAAVAAADATLEKALQSLADQEAQAVADFSVALEKLREAERESANQGNGRANGRGNSASGQMRTTLSAR